MIKIAIVGADGQNKAWTPLREDRAKQAIQSILYRYAIPNSISVMESIKYYDPASIVLVSGHSPKGGVDIWAEEVADEFGIKKEIYPAEVNQWEDKYFCKECGPQKQWNSLEVMLKDHPALKDYPDLQGRLKGYRSRNIQIAECCDILYDIELKGSCKHCGGKGLLEFRNHETCNYCKGTGNYSGGTWTYRKALEFGKEAHQIIIDR